MRHPLLQSPKSSHSTGYWDHGVPAGIRAADNSHRITRTLIRGSYRPIGFQSLKNNFRLGGNPIYHRMLSAGISVLPEDVMDQYTPGSGEKTGQARPRYFACGDTKRSAWLIYPALTSSYLTSPGKTASPASSVDHMGVTLFFLNLYPFRSQTAPELAFHEPSGNCSLQTVHREPSHPCQWSPCGGHCMPLQIADWWV